MGGVGGYLKGERGGPGSYLALGAKRQYAHKPAKRPPLITVLNQRWALLVLQSLIDGPKRFNEICKSTGVNPNTLRDRLRDFESIGVVSRTVFSETPPNVVYSLTAEAEALRDVLDQLFEWAIRNSGKAVVMVDESHGGGDLE